MIRVDNNPAAFNGRKSWYMMRVVVGLETLGERGNSS